MRGKDEKIRKNQSTMLVYWFCATDARLLQRVLDEGKSPLEKLGIPGRYITKAALDAVRRQEYLFRAFSAFVTDYCHPRPCTDLSMSALRAEIIKCVYLMEGKRKQARKKTK